MLTLEGLQLLGLVRVSSCEGSQRWGFLRSQIFTPLRSQAGAIRGDGGHLLNQFQMGVVYLALRKKLISTKLCQSKFFR